MGASDFQRRGSHLLPSLGFVSCTSPHPRTLPMHAPLRKKNKWLPKIHQWVQEHGGGNMIPFSIEWEQKLWNLRDDPDGQKAFLDTEPKSISALPKMIVQGYKELVGVGPVHCQCLGFNNASPRPYPSQDLMYYFTAGDTEVRCWTFLKGTLAPQVMELHNGGLFLIISIRDVFIRCDSFS